MAFLETVGLEIEGSGLTKEYVAQLLAKKIVNWRECFTVGRDASVEATVKRISPTISVFGHDTISQRCDNIFDQEVYGYEVTTLPLEFRDSERIVHLILNTLIAHGETISPRASTHIHVGYADSFQLLHSAFVVGMWLEPLFYKFAGMGNQFRGYVNNSIYCRPLELSVGVMGQDSNWYSLLNTDSILKAESTEKFWWHYNIAIKSYKMHMERYHPARYFGFNLLSIPLHGTLEFRFFNSCLDSSWISSMTRFCQAVTELTTKLPRNIVEQLTANAYSKNHKSLTESWSDRELHELLDKVEYYFDRADLTFNTESRHRRTLRQIIDGTPMPEFSKDVPKSHIKNYILSSEAMEPNIHPRLSKVIDSGYVDIHNIGNHYYSSISVED